jgi:hypothetical protein
MRKNNIEDLVAWRATLLNTLKNFDRNQGMHAIFVDKAMLESDSVLCVMRSSGGGIHLGVIINES